MHLRKRHPFPVSAHFDQSLVLTFALPPKELESLLPPPLQLDTFNDEHAFVAVAMVQTRQLRPSAFPAFLGNDFFLVGYRIFTRYVNQAGKRLRGLYILESQTDSRKMELLGNLMTHYNYRRISVSQQLTANAYRVASPSEGFNVSVRYENDPDLPAGSPFTDWKEARRFAGPLPFTFTYLAESREMLIVEGRRQNWKPRPVAVESLTLPWLEKRGWKPATLASAFVVQDIPYSWKKGIVEHAKPGKNDR